MQPSGTNSAGAVRTVPPADLSTSALCKAEAIKIAAGNIRATTDAIWSHEAPAGLFRLFFIGQGGPRSRQHIRKMKVRRLYDTLLAEAAEPCQ
jgi:hypothetical protein